MQQWEYMRVSIQNDNSLNAPVHRSHSAPKRIFVLGADGEYVEWGKPTREKNSSPNVSTMLKQMGDEGYELVCSANGVNDMEVVLYFKRPKQN